MAWRWLLPAVFAAGFAWMLSLALVDGAHGIGHILRRPTSTSARRARPPTCTGCCASTSAASRTLGAPAQLAGAHCRASAGRIAVLRRPRPPRSRRRTRRRDRRIGPRGDDRRGGHGHRPDPRERGAGPAERAVPGLRTGGGLAGRLGRRDVRGRRGVEPRRGGDGGDASQRRLVDRGRAVARRLRDAVLRPVTARDPDGDRAPPRALWLPLPIVAIARSRSSRRSRSSGSPTSTRCPPCTSATSTVSGAGVRRAYWAWGGLAALAVSAGPLAGAGLAQLSARRVHASATDRPGRSPRSPPPAWPACWSPMPPS